jgi:hypothetical protein
MISRSAVGQSSMSLGRVAGLALAGLSSSVIIRK